MCPRLIPDHEITELNNNLVEHVGKTEKHGKLADVIVELVNNKLKERGLLDVTKDHCLNTLKSYHYNATQYDPRTSVVVSNEKITETSQPMDLGSNFKALKKCGKKFTAIKIVKHHCQFLLWIHLLNYKTKVY